MFFDFLANEMSESAVILLINFKFCLFSILLFVLYFFVNLITTFVYFMTFFVLPIIRCDYL